MQEELSIIMDLMKDLQDKMQYGEDDFSERLGRKKPEVEISKVSVDGPEAGEDEMMEDEEECELGEEEESPEDKLKSRLMRMRG